MKKKSLRNGGFSCIYYLDVTKCILNGFQEWICLNWDLNIASWKCNFFLWPILLQRKWKFLNLSSKVLRYTHKLIDYEVLKFEIDVWTTIRLPSKKFKMSADAILKNDISTFYRRIMHNYVISNICTIFGPLAIKMLDSALKYNFTYLVHGFLGLFNF